MATHLILAPHHDDAEFGLGATIQKWISKGDVVHVVIAAGGSYQRADGSVVEGQSRVLETQAAMDILGVKSCTLADWFKENKALAVDYGGLVWLIERQIAHVMATNVYVCLPSFNQDHRVLFDAAVTAFRPGGAKANLYAYEYPGNQYTNQPPEFGRRYHPASTRKANKKIEALRAHKSQFDGRVGGVSPDAAMILGAMRGHEIGVPFAEVTFVIKEIVN
ncbi:PIG-L family deacetylase [Brucella intermedia]|uniref:PIG-L deacetylase family protein n=1 Tax=Brucella TaxID=234 RepID=UPI00094635F0|nr:PIG-L family deacetylase [Brucella intermedia]